MSPETTDKNRVCREEETAQSKIPGPGPVKDCECLARVVLDPIHLENGELNVRFLTLDHLEKGWSFIRREIAGEKKIKAHGESQAARGGGQKMHGYAVVKTAEFRAIRDDEGRQAFCILDDEREDAPAHAIAKKSADRKKNKLRELREELLNLLGRNLTPC